MVIEADMLKNMMNIIITMLIMILHYDISATNDVEVDDQGKISDIS